MLQCGSPVFQSALFLNEITGNETNSKQLSHFWPLQPLNSLILYLSCGGDRFFNFFFFFFSQQESRTANTAAFWRWSALSNGCSHSRSSPPSTMAAGLAGKLWRRSLGNGSWRRKLSTNYQEENCSGAELLLITIITASNAVAQDCKKSHLKFSLRLLSFKH